MSTLRISDIPSSTTKMQLCKALSVAADRLSLAQGQATVTFSSPAAAARFRSQHPYPRCLGRRPRVDADFLGLTVLAASPDPGDDEIEYIPPPSPPSRALLPPSHSSHLPLPSPSAR